MRAAVIVSLLAAAAATAGAVAAQELELQFDLAVAEVSPFGSHDDVGKAIARDDVEASIVVGGTLGDATSVCGAPSHAFVNKRGRGGEERWRRHGGADAANELFAGIAGLDPSWVVESSVDAVAVEPASGNVFAAGAMTVAWPAGGCRTFTTLGAFVLKLSPQGDPLAGTYLGVRPATVSPPSGPCFTACGRAPSSQHEQIAVRALALTSDGHLAVAGWLRRGSASGIADPDVFVARLDADLHLLWRARLGSAAPDVGLGVAVDSLGDVLVTGYGGLEHDVFVARYRAAAGAGQGGAGQGVLAGLFMAGGDGVDEGRGIAVDSEDHLVVSGVTTGSVQFGHPAVTLHGTGREAFLAKLDPGLGLAWVRSVGSPADEEAYGIAIGPADDVFIVGAYAGPYVVFRDKKEETVWELQSPSGGALFLGMYNSEGMLCWATGAHGSAAGDVAHGLAVAVVRPPVVDDEAGPDVAVTGRFRGAVDFPSEESRQLSLANPHGSFDILTAAIVGPAPFADDGSDSGFEHGRDIGKFRGDKPRQMP